MIIEMPFNLDMISSLVFIKHLDSLEIEDEDIIFDYSNLISFRPFGMLLVSSKIS